MLKTELGRIRDLVLERADEFFSDKKNVSVGMGEFIQEFLDNLHEYMQGGKAVRAGLVYYGAIACGGKEN